MAAVLEFAKRFVPSLMTWALVAVAAVSFWTLRKLEVDLFGPGPGASHIPDLYMENFVTTAMGLFAAIPALVMSREPPAIRALAVLTAVLTTVVSFLPVFTMIGAEGKLFKPLAYTKTFALIASIILALTVLPPLAHLLFTRMKKHGHPGFLQSRTRNGLFTLRRLQSSHSWSIRSLMKDSSTWR